MKLPKAIISGQNFYLKLAIFLTGLMTGLESSLRQLVSQLALILLLLLFEPILYLSLGLALKRILPFLAGYWVFAILFSQPFPASVFFSLQILYFLLISVYVFGNVQMQTMAADSATFRRFKPANAAFFFSLATYHYLKSFYRNYKAIKSEQDKPILPLVSEVMQQVASETESIRSRVNSVLSVQTGETEHRSAANLTGWLALTCLVLIHSI